MVDQVPKLGENMPGRRAKIDTSGTDRLGTPMTRSATGNWSDGKRKVNSLKFEKGTV